MRHLADLNHEVVGLEFSAQGIEEFFKEHNLKYTKKKSTVIPEFIEYKADKTLITIFQGDFFQVTSKLLGRFDAIWDRGSLVAINPSERIKYAKIIESLVTTDTRYMVQAVNYNQSHYGGPPFALPFTDLRDLFCSKFNIDDLLIEQSSDSEQKYGIQWFFNTLYLLTPKFELVRAVQSCTNTSNLARKRWGDSLTKLNSLTSLFKRNDSKP